MNFQTFSGCPIQIEGLQKDYVMQQGFQPFSGLPNPVQFRLEGLQAVHESDADRYKKSFSNLQADSAKTKEQLVSENMVLAKKLDALEEFR